mmetsp:Transcript_33252/g.100463  ORF Transcript_33252/g.100463 Transcript_33252/m.100463 type:complete len:115 (-) Transcript_33252:544-888(-)
MVWSTRLEGVTEWRNIGMAPLFLRSSAAAVGKKDRKGCVTEADSLTVVNTGDRDCWMVLVTRVVDVGRIVVDWNLSTDPDGDTLTMDCARSLTATCLVEAAGGRGVHRVRPMTP